MINQYKINIKAEKIKNIEQMLSEIENDKFFAYPWNEIEDELHRNSIGELNFVGYGSIINEQSAARTFTNLPHKSYKNVLAFGVRRLFNYEMPSDRYGTPANPLNRAALNVKYTGNSDDIVNGILVRLPINFISNFRKREIDYDLIPVICLDWSNNNNSVIKAYILRCPDEIRYGKKRTNSNIMPHLKYYKICRDGAQARGVEFLNLWLNTTYLADEITPVAQWEKEEFQKLR